MSFFEIQTYNFNVNNVFKGYELIDLKVLKWYTYSVIKNRK